MDKQVQRRRRPVPVVTVFLTNSGRVALFERSQRVGTYKGYWAGVSGYIERMPLHQAYTEVCEEAGLGPEDAHLRGIGIPLEVDDPEAGRSWIVHPFLMEVADPAKVRTDWEAARVEWVRPDSLDSFRCVPGLGRALRSVWPPFGDDGFWSGLAEVAVDTERGATSLALSALGMLESYLERDSSAPRDRAVCAFAACRPSMGVFPHLAARILTGRANSAELARELEAAASESAIRAAEVLATHERILTNSHSSAVQQAILARRGSGRPLEVTVMESRPGMEGVTLARELAVKGARVSVITDAQAGLFVPEMDAVLFGCDAITADDEVQNKAGTRLAVLAARAAGIPAYAVTQTQKIVPPGFPRVAEEQEPGDVGRDAMLRFRNLVFDATPIEWFDAVITESGPLTADMLRSVRASLRPVGPE